MAILSGKQSQSAAVTPPGNDRAAKLLFPSAKAIASNRVDAQDRKTYLHAEQRNRSQQTEYTRHSYAYTGDQTPYRALPINHRSHHPPPLNR